MSDNCTDGTERAENWIVCCCACGQLHSDQMPMELANYTAKIHESNHNDFHSTEIEHHSLDTDSEQ